MKLVLASNNKHKLDEFRDILEEFEIFSISDILKKDIEIIENAKTFKENAFIKSKTIFNELEKIGKNKEFVVLADDSGLCVKDLDYEPGIFSARYAGAKASDKENKEKLISNLKAKNIKESSAYFISAIALSSNFGEYSVISKLNGKVISKEEGENGFGYDSLFIPDGFNLTIASLDTKIKNQISHRKKALDNMKLILKFLKKFYK